jgi:hypothetical protein
VNNPDDFVKFGFNPVITLHCHPDPDQLCLQPRPVLGDRYRRYCRSVRNRSINWRAQTDWQSALFLKLPTLELPNVAIPARRLVVACFMHVEWEA